LDHYWTEEAKMKINNVGINDFNADLQKLGKIKEKQTGEFGKMFSNFVSNVNDMQQDADNKTADFIHGVNNVEIHDVMIAEEKARTSLQLLMEIRNKGIDMFKELTRMQ